MLASEQKYENIKRKHTVVTKGMKDQVSKEGKSIYIAPSFTIPVWLSHSHPFI